MLRTVDPRPEGAGLVDGRFLLLESLGQGGMGAVYRAFDRAEQRLVALKVATEPQPAGPAHPLATEFEAWAGLDHPNIVRAYELGLAASGPLEAGTPYLVLEHVAGEPLHRVLAAGRVSAAAAVSLARQVLEALAHVHGRGWLHRDLKPANLLVHARREVKLTDFGLATRVGASSQAGTVSGSLPYLAPEVLLGLPLDERADLYGLGILLYQLVTGELPARSLSARDVLHWHLCGPPADPSAVRPRLPERLGRFIRRLAARDRAARPLDARDALRLLGVRGPRTAAVDAGPGRAQERGARARLRLALDAARLGTVRVHRLPGVRDSARALLAEVSVWAQARGMRLHRIQGRERAVRLSLARLVLRECPCGERQDLAEALPLRFVGAVAVLDRSRLQAARNTSAAAEGARLAAFLVECSRSRPAVVVLERSALAEPLVREIVRRLGAAARRGPGDGAGGLLVLLAPDDRTAARHAPARGRLSRAAARSPDAARAPTC